MRTPEGPRPRVALAPTPQVVWGGLAVVNFACGGTGAGAVLGILAVALLAPVPPRTVRAIEALGLALAGIGFAAVGAEAGRPLRGINVFRHLRRSWMSREALAAALFGGCIGLDVLVPGPWQRAAGTAAALAFMLSQGFILYAARGVPAWATWETPVCFATGGLVGGLGTVLVALAALAGPRDALGVGMRLGLIALVPDMVAWAAYAGGRHGSPAKRAAMARLRSGWVAAAGVGLGQLAPFVVLLLVLGVGEPTPGRGGGAVVLLAGLAMAAGGAIRKWAIVRRAGLLHSLGLDAFRSVGRPGAAEPAPGAALRFPQT